MSSYRRTTNSAAIYSLPSTPTYAISPATSPSASRNAQSPYFAASSPYAQHQHYPFQNHASPQSASPAYPLPLMTPTATGPFFQNHSSVVPLGSAKQPTAQSHPFQQPGRPSNNTSAGVSPPRSSTFPNQKPSTSVASNGLLSYTTTTSPTDIGNTVIGAVMNPIHPSGSLSRTTTPLSEDQSQSPKQTPAPTNHVSSASNTSLVASSAGPKASRHGGTPGSGTASPIPGQMSAGNQHTLARPLLQAPIPAMHWSRVKARGAVKPPASLRAHSMNLVTSDGLLLVFGGCDAKSCFGDLYVFDAETMVWSKPRVTGDLPEPCRAHSAVLVNDKLYIFGGGDGPDYFSTLHVLDIPTYNWSRLDLPNTPSPRRAHTAWAYENCMYVYAGGDGVQALDDLYCLDTETLQWRHLQTFWEGEPQVSQNPRGYHTATLIGHKVLVFGGSDGRECFSDVRLLDLTTLTWQVLSTDRVVPRLAHTATQVGSYLFVLGGHDGVSYNNEVLLLNLVTMSWEARRVFGTLMPSPRGYHSAVLYDSRLYVFGGYDGADVFGDMWVLDLSACAYLPQITSFDIASDVQMS